MVGCVRGVPAGLWECIGGEGTQAIKSSVAGKMYLKAKSGWQHVWRRAVLSLEDTIFGASRGSRRLESE